MAGGMHSKGGHAWQRGVCVVRGACMVKGGCVWDMMRYGDTINEQAVCILLECILVLLFVWSGTGTRTGKNGLYGFNKNLSHCT